ncbi:putative membrane protein [Thermocatellispora tengchongensis]|uniref:Putative membrane protein n=1 Tax=Thermocatellispora tengchongensis TaxID=1073253 RepID=A0A840PPK2_9ACTN|nr:anthrone oxygenase family protein [Thermocatellispora tengchongensis]MBB5139007.1 putative membrane protein [Thermocatellispora tengchongensis]
MTVLQTICLVAATVTTGSMAGLFTAFSYAVMPGLARSSDRTLVETMKQINLVIINPWFLVQFVGSIPLLVLATVLAWLGHGEESLGWIAAATVLYVVAFVVTVARNVPLNNRLEAAGDVDAITDLAGVRERYEGPWVRWNLVRALLHTAAFGCLVWALVPYAAG